MSNINVNMCGIDFKNPVIAASGTFGFGEEYNEYFDVSKLGGICSKGLTFNPKEGNEGERVFEVTGGMMNSVGLQNPGVKEFIKNELPKMNNFDTVAIVNLGGSCEEDYINGMKLLENTNAEMIELNISCPNVKHGGMAFGIKSEVAYKVVSEVRSVTSKPLMVKLSPNAEDIVDMAVKCEKAGADAISLVNTFKGMAIDIKKKKPVFNNISAGVSGRAIKPIALRMVYEVCKNVTVPVVGMGGIYTAEDAIEFIMAGATAIQVGTANFIKPDVCLDIIEGMEKFLQQEGIEHIKNIRGIL
ncbi:dihydroorotate dehydrogenase [Clostridium felsineum]|uniref:Dihydroorotate dehydrogenase n=1 Tax=Clostridium felsineum TaxID=36839 RepID=A0A1S8KZT5_9CLOT|nr:dihydroorotate dehydrogenase [Clostridium felsineum]URZ07653.1 Dihydroorotate dehydrogenase B (NAD(+)), catalytic subunit [Clostridium felsineum]URZ12684.1 Dihydroorotate dehydrogenase B (NAD(+)), catalytic subunit [Clostridium felsineum]